MINIDEIRLEERHEYSAITWGIISAIILGVLSYLLQNERLLDSYNSEAPFYALVLMYLAVTIAITVWVVKIARKLNRAPVIWAIFAFLFPPLTLIVLGFQDYKIEDKYIKWIVDQARIDFDMELSDIKNTQNLTAEQLKNVELRLKEKYSNNLREKIRESMYDLSQSSKGQEEQTIP
jgi:amino acid permease